MKNWTSHVFVIVCFLFLFLLCSCFCHVLNLRSFNSQLHSALSVVGYHARGQDVGKYCPLQEPIRIPPAHDERNK